MILPKLIEDSISSSPPYAYNGEYFYRADGRNFQYKRNFDDDWTSVEIVTSSAIETSYTVYSYVIWNGSYFAFVASGANTTNGNKAALRHYLINPATMKSISSGSNSSYTGLSFYGAVLDEDTGSCYFLGKIGSTGYLIKFSVSGSSASTVATSKSLLSSGYFIFKKGGSIFWGCQSGSSRYLYETLATTGSSLGETTSITATTSKDICGYAGEYWIKTVSGGNVDRTKIFIGKGDSYSNVSEWTEISLSNMGFEGRFGGMDSSSNYVAGWLIAYLEEYNIYIASLQNLGSNGYYGFMYTATPEDISSWKFVEVSSSFSSANRYWPYCFDSKIFLPSNLIISVTKPEGLFTEITVENAKTQFKLQDEFSLGTDAVLYATYENGQFEIVDGYDIANPDMNSAGIKKVTVSYTDDNDTTVSTNYTIEVINAFGIDYTGAAQEYTLGPGTYKLQVWGAQGGSYSATSSYQGGYGGYSEGILTLTEETPIYIYVGGQPSPVNTSTDPTAGGFNGGGAGEYSQYSTSYTCYAQGGGGGTDIRIGTDSLYARVIVAGGGGGSAYCAGGTSFNALTTRYGGGLTAGSYNSSYQATQTSGYKFGIGQNSPDSSSARYLSGAGGGGWYGGKLSTSTSTSSSGNVYSTMNSGGSGYVYTAETAVNYPEGCLLNESYYLTEAATLGYGSEQIPTTDLSGFEPGHLGHGYVLITVLSEKSSGTVLKYYTIDGFKDTNPMYFNGTEFIQCDAHYYNGTEFIKI